MTALSDAHDKLRDAIRAVAIEQWKASEIEEGVEVINQSILVDYITVAAFDSGPTTTMMLFRTDGFCSKYRVLGLLEMGQELI